MLDCSWHTILEKNQDIWNGRVQLAHYHWKKEGMKATLAKYELEISFAWKAQPY
jgi:hypothetical protein